MGRVSSVFGILSNYRIYSSPSTLYCRSLSLRDTNDEFSEFVVWPVACESDRRYRVVASKFFRYECVEVER